MKRAIKRLAKPAMKLDPVTLAVMNNRLAAIAEEMGVVLGQTGFSPNIKERHDFSCALFDSGGELVAQAAHVPVHLGSTPLSVRAAIERLELGPGDVAAVNDPFAGGTHLPDLTLVAPIFLGDDRRPFAFAANRAHHADIGGMAPGSMALSTEIYQEGFRLPPVHIVRAGKPARDVLELFFANTRVRATCARKSRRSTSAPSGCAGWWQRAGARSWPQRWRRSRITRIA
jgi:N-methylhydantoinase B